MSSYDAAYAEAVAELWRRGEAHRWLLDTHGPTGGQQAWLEMLRALPPGTWAAWKIARQRGKTFSVLSWIVERMMAETISGVYLAQTQSNAQSIVGGWIQQVGRTLPPEWDVRLVDGTLRFASGSELGIFGTDNDQYRRRRGNAVKLAAFDEAAFYSDLPSVEQVYVPQLQTTNGTGIYLSSPPLTPAHPFNDRCRSAMASGRFVRDTFWSNPRINHEAIIRGECERLGMTREQLLASTYFRREYLAEDVTEESRAALPAWNEHVAAELVGDWPMPEHFDGYEAHDGGLFNDPHASLFAVHDPATNSVTIHDELEMRSSTTTISAWSDEVKTTEARLYGTNAWNGTLLGADYMRQQLRDVPEFLREGLERGAPRQPYVRVSDPSQDICRDLTIDHKLVVFPAPARHEKAMNVDLVNQLIVDRRLKIHRRCRRLLEQMSSTLWDVHRRRWERTDKDHGDLIDCFEGGTMITTRRGEVPVEQVRTGDEAWTRQGWKPVIIAHAGREAPLWEVETSNGRVLRGTSEHPFWTQRGWVALSLLTPSDTLFTWSQSLSNGAGEHGEGIHTARGETIASTTEAQEVARKSTFIGLSMRRLMDLFLKGSSFIMSMGIRSTTSHRTLRPSPLPTTSESTWTPSDAGWPQRPQKEPSPESTYKAKSPSGAQAQKVSRFIVSMVGKFGLAFRFGPSPAPSVDPVSSQETREAQLCAATHVLPRSDEEVDWMTRVALAWNVEPPSRATSTLPSGFVGVRVRRVTETGRVARVFNLAVAGAHEYVANGVLVHNCLTYIVRVVRWNRDCRPKHEDMYLREVKRIQAAHTKEATSWDKVFKR